MFSTVNDTVALLHSLVYATVTRLVEMQVTPPVFMSANVGDTGDHNARLIARYGARLRHL